MRINYLFYLVIAASLCSISSLAATNPTPAQQPVVYGPSPSPTPIPEKLDQFLIRKDIELTKKIEEVADKLDLAVTGKKEVSKANLTKITLRNQLNYAEGGNFSYAPHLDLQLHLPNLEKKLRLKFTTYDEDQETLGINKQRLKTQPYQNNLAGKFGFLQKLGQVNAEFQPAVEYRSSFLLSYLLKLTSSANTNHFMAHPEAQFFARSDSGVGEFLAPNMVFPVSRKVMVALINEEQYVDQSNIFSTNQGLSIGYEHTDYIYQTLSVVYESSSRPSYHLDRYTVSTGITHKIYREILHYIITPYIAFPRNLDFKWSPGINLEVDLIF